MEIRFAVGLILIAVGALLALLGGMSVFMPNDAGVGFRIGCGSMGLVGLVMALAGLRLRNRAVAESPDLKRSLESNHEEETSRTERKMPGFLAGRAAPAPGANPAPPPAQPPQSRVPPSPLVYWLIFVAFVVVVLGLLVGTLDFFEGRTKFIAVYLVLALVLMLLFPAMWVWRARYVGRGTWGGHHPTGSDSGGSAIDSGTGGGDSGGDGGGD